MADNKDNFEWARRLGCPASALRNPIQKSLNSGIGGLLWEELAKVSRPTKEVLESRKNILLYKLKHGEEDAAMQQIRQIQQLNAASSQLQPQIESLEKEWEQISLLAAQQNQKLLNVKRRRESINTKEKLFQMKFEELQMQIKDCKDMRVVCQRLMPPTSCEIDPQIVTDSLSLVGTISSKAEKRMARKRISETLGKSEISSLWNILLSRLTRDTEQLMALGTHKIADTKPHAVTTKGEDMDTGVARVCGEHIASVLKSMIHRVKSNRIENSVMDCIKEIEMLDTNCVDISEWLALTLEVCKLETEQLVLESEIDNLRKTCEDQSELENELSNVESDIRSINTKVETCAQEIQNSSTLLNNAGSDIIRTKESLLLVMEKVVTLQNKNENANYLDIDLGTELNIFHDTVQLEALRKIFLKDGVGAYRHTNDCISEAQLSITTPSQSNDKSQFPMIRAPIYELLNCYKFSVAAAYLTKLENELETNEHNFVDELMAEEIPNDCSSGAIQILNTTDLTCDKVRQELRHFDSIYDAWINQTVQKAMALTDGTVNGATYKEWQKRIETLIYMTRRKK